MRKTRRTYTYKTALTMLHEGAKKELHTHTHTHTHTQNRALTMHHEEDKKELHTYIHIHTHIHTPTEIFLPEMTWQSGRGD